MYLVEAYSSPEEFKESMMARFFKNLQIGEIVARLELWGTDLEDPGKDYTELRLFDARNTRLTIRRCKGV